MTALLAIIYVSFISLGLPDSVLGSVWPAMRESLGAPLELAGYLSMTVTAGTVTSSFCCDWSVARFGTGRVTAVSVGMTAAALLGFALSPAVWCLFLFAVLLGLGAGCVDAALNNYVALHYEAKHMNWLHCFWGLGASGGPVIASACLALGGSWRGGYGVISALQAVLCLVLFLNLRHWKAENAEREVTAAQPRCSKLELLQIRGVVASLTAFICYCAAETTAGLWSASFLHGRFAWTAERAAIASTVFFGAITAGRIISGFLAQKLSDEGMIRLGALISLGGAVLTLVSPVPLAALVGICLMGLGMAPIYPAMIHVTPRRYGAARSQSLIGMEMAFAYAGSTCFPAMFGILAERFSVKLFPGYLLLICIGLLVLTELAGLRARGLERDD